MISRQSIMLMTCLATYISIAQAETFLYGSIRLGVDVGNNYGEPQIWSPIDPNIQKSGKRAINMRDEGSLLGLKGNETLGNGLEVIYQLEWKFDAAEGQNNGSGFENAIAYVGLQGGFGRLTIGRIEHPFRLMLAEKSAFDESNSGWVSGALTAVSDVFFGHMGSINTFDADMVEYIGNSIAYYSPDWNGLSFNATAMLDQDKMEDDTPLWNKKRGVDLWSANIAYEHDSGLYAGLGYISGTMTKARAYAYGLQVGFNAEQWGVNANFAQGRTKGDETFGAGNDISEYFWDNAELNEDLDHYQHRATGWDVGGYVSFGQDNMSTLRASIGQANADKKRSSLSYLDTIKDKESNKMTVWAIGFEQKLSARTRVWFEYENINVKQSFSSQTDNQIEDYPISYDPYKFKNDRVSIVMRHDF